MNKPISFSTRHQKKSQGCPTSHDIKITVYVDLPWHSEPIAKRIDIDGFNTGRCLNPLPREREIFSDAAKEAVDQTMERERLINIVSGELAKALTDAIFEAVESRDPQHGYSPEEWKKINKDGDSQ